MSTEIPAATVRELVEVTMNAAREASKDNPTHMLVVKWLELVVREALESVSSEYTVRNRILESDPLLEYIRHDLPEAPSEAVDAVSRPLSEWDGVTPGRYGNVVVVRA